jgi:hypothetical protein
VEATNTWGIFGGWLPSRTQFKTNRGGTPSRCRLNLRTKRGRGGGGGVWWGNIYNMTFGSSFVSKGVAVFQATCMGGGGCASSRLLHRCRGHDDDDATRTKRKLWNAKNSCQSSPVIPAPLECWPKGVAHRHLSTSPMQQGQDNSAASTMLSTVSVIPRPKFSNQIENPS